MLSAKDAADELARAEALLSSRALIETRAAFERARISGADPDRCSGGLWLAAMLAGGFAAAWNESDAIRARGTPDPHRFWQGEPLEGKRVIVRCLHGLGDAIQMLRYAPMLRQVAHTVTYEVPPRLLSLTPFFDGVEHAITWGDAAPAQPPAWDVQIEVMELPYIARTTLLHLPIAELYLRIPSPQVLETRAAMQLNRNLAVGVVWAGGDWNPERSLPLPLLQPLLETSAVEFWNLQGSGAAHQAHGLPLRDAAACGDGLVPLAAVIANLDLVLTVDTLAAHLAGALGKPVWVMLQHAADWRWMTNRSDSPWYPTMRLFRQPTPGDWTGVIAAVQQALEQLVAGRLEP